MQKTHHEASKFESPHRVQRRRDLGFSLIMSQHMVNCWIKDQTEWQNQTYCTETSGFDPKKSLLMHLWNWNKMVCVRYLKL